MPFSIRPSRRFPVLVTWNYVVSGGFGTFSCITEGDEMRMKMRTAIFMLIASLLGLIGCQELGDKDR